MFIATICSALYQRLILLCIIFYCSTSMASENSYKNNGQNQVTQSSKLKFESASGHVNYQIGGRIQGDVASYHGHGDSFAGGTEFRRARFFVKGKMYKKWLFKTQLDFSDSEVEIKDLYLGYRFDNNRIRVGQFGEFGSLEDTTSSKYITFMERSLPVLAFSLNERCIGLGLNGFNNNSSYAVGIFSDSQAQASADRGKGASVRYSYAPWLDKTHLLHLGISHQYRAPPHHSMRFRARSESHVDNNRLISSGKINNVGHYTSSGLELAWVKGPLSIQSEYIQTRVSRKNGLDHLGFDGYYTYVSWFLTGESRPFDVKEGSFDKVKPKQSFSASGMGAWELALRLSHLDLNNKEISGGKQNNITFGLNWYVDPNIRFMFNYVNVDTDHYAGNIDLDIFQLRAQIFY
jgi:phosphate-selective porin OprO/OprP